MSNMEEMQKRKICVVNGKRGGFNALLPTMLRIADDSELELQVVLTDMHLSNLFGRTLEYAKEKIKVNKTVDIGQTGSTPRERTEALGRGLTGMAQALDELKPDIILILGDRSETLIAAFAALQLRIPIAHVQGGEISGNIDGIQRHAITKLAHIHFAETEEARKRILQLGEERWRVHRSGAPYVDFIKLKLYTPATEVRKKFSLLPDEQFLLVLQHPVTTEPESSAPHMKEILDAVEATGLRAIIAYPCSDQGYQGILDEIEKCRSNPKISIHKNIPAEDFIGLQAIASALVGNSSAGIYEAPYLHCPFVNVGKRQAKREKEKNVIDVAPEKEAIIAGIRKALDDKNFHEEIKTAKFVYGDGNAYKRIVTVLKTVPLGKRLFEKRSTYYSWRRQIIDYYYLPLRQRLLKFFE